MNQHWMMDIMVEHFNTDDKGKVWEPTLNDLGYRVWCILKPGVGFVFDGSVYADGFTGLGSRLHFRSYEIAKIATKSLEVHQNRLFNF
jgi:hypothetical protein